MSLFAFVLVWLGATGSASATTLMRSSLENLTRTSQDIVMGTVTASNSYWNADKTFIYTDVTISVGESFKGSRRAGRTIVVTLMGGTVGDLSTVIVAGPELAVGGKYLLFLSNRLIRDGVPVLSVSNLCQGVFVLTGSGSGAKLTSEAAEQALVPDGAGLTDPPGGLDGMSLGDMRQALKSLTAESR